jgi:hypothetical protein
MVMPQLSSARKYLVPQCVEKNDGVGPIIALDTLRGKQLVVTLGIDDVLEHEGLAISIGGSTSGTDWEPIPLLVFPQKSYCGVYATILSLAKNPTIRFLRVKWTMSRWAQRDSDLMFGFFVSLEEMHSEVSAAVA